MPLAEKRAFAHFEVDTSGSLDDTDRQADALAEELAGIVRRPRAGRGGGIETLLGGPAYGPGKGPRRPPACPSPWPRGPGGAAPPTLRSWPRPRDRSRGSATPILPRGRTRAC